MQLLPGEQRGTLSKRAQGERVEPQDKGRIPDREAILGSIKEFLGTGR